MRTMGFRNELRVRRQRLAKWLLLGVHALGFAGAAQAVDVIVNPGVSVSAVSASTARAIFAMKLSQWPDGKPVRVFVLGDDTLGHQSLCKQVLDLYPYQIREAWNRLIYTGIGQAPATVSTEEEMLRKVASTPGAIGYVMKAEKNETIRALAIR